MKGLSLTMDDTPQPYNRLFGFSYYLCLLICFYKQAIRSPTNIIKILLFFYLDVSHKKATLFIYSETPLP